MDWLGGEDSDAHAVVHCVCACLREQTRWDDEGGDQKKNLALCTVREKVCVAKQHEPN